MAVRGVVTVLEFYPSDYNINTAPLYSFQNHFPGTRTIAGFTYTYNSFQVSSSVMERDASLRDMSVTFVATAANVDLVENSVNNRYALLILTYRWSSTEGIDNPSGYNLLSAFSGNAVSGSADLSTVTLQVGSYSDSLNTDIPWRKIPWTILGPLSFRR